MATIIVKGAEQVLVLGIREALIYPGVIPNWLDVRIGAFVSLTKAAADDDPTGLTETLTTAGAEADRLYLGMKDSTNSLPRSCPFFGVSNSLAVEGAANSIVESIDTNTRWRSKNASGATGVLLNDGSSILVSGAMEPFRTIQAPGSLSGNYATLVLLRAVRSLVGNTIDNLYVAKTTDVTDYADAGIETAAPSIDAIRNAFRTVTWTEVFAGGHTFSSVPNSFYAYWPYSNSRLRIHSIVIEKFA